jgi:1-pyrroline-5-carboxylate dehydrogenase
MMQQQEQQKSSKFENENTFGRLKATGREEEFHRLYEDAVRLVRSKLGATYPMVIGGIETTSSEGTFVDYSPSDTKLVVGHFQKGTREDARRAIEASLKAFNSWSLVDYKQRVAIYRKAAEIMSIKKFELAAEMSFENGKNRYEALADVDEAIDFLRYYAWQLEENQGFVHPMGRLAPGEHSKSVLRPYGVWSVIAPFNFPLAIATGMTSGASITGNTVVLKPASDTPMMSYELVRILHEAGLPPGVVNFVTGPGSTVGSELIENKNIAGVVFTGSYEVGANSISDFEKASPRPFVAEMGGKNATIVTSNADLEKSAEGVFRGAFGFGGQKCSACSRVYVQNSIKEEFVKRLAEKTAKIKVGDPTERDVFLGPLINESAYKNYQQDIEEARKVNAKIVYGGETLREGKSADGYFVKPTLIVDAPENSKIVKTELFVPIVVVEPFETLDEAIEKVNDVDYGLTAGIFSKDKSEIDKFFERVQAGVLYANRVSGSTTGAVVGVQSFVGWKHSGSSGKGAGGPWYLQQFLREQSQTYYD